MGHPSSHYLQLVRKVLSVQHKLFSPFLSLISLFISFFNLSHFCCFVCVCIFHLIVI